jgi:AcrR family transcriptional regulator
VSGKATYEQIVEVADQLFYQRGYEHTSFADIAVAVRISRGNFYYHFKSKDEILVAVLALRQKKTQEMLHAWEQACAAPLDRIRCFFQMMVANQTLIMNYGCPVGTMCAELAKLNHGSLEDAKQLFSLFREWLCRQFSLLGHASEADAYALHLLVRSQGIASLANAFRDEAMLASEVGYLEHWLSTLPGKPRQRDQVISIP